jgi:hypothetical protein
VVEAVGGGWPYIDISPFSSSTLPPPTAYRFNHLSKKFIKYMPERGDRDLSFGTFVRSIALKLAAGDGFKVCQNRDFAYVPNFCSVSFS